MSLSQTETVKRRVRGTGRPPGRPTKLTPALTERICEKIRLGVPADAAAVSLGVARTTFMTWLRDARGEGASPRHQEFLLAFDQAQAEFHEKMVGIAVSDPKNAVPILERRFRRDWARQDRHQVDVNVTARPLIDPSKGSLERLQLLRELLAEFSPDAIDVPRDGAPAIELLAGIVEGELVSEEEVA
jgi:hypothetical protein